MNKEQLIWYATEHRLHFDIWYDTVECEWEAEAQADGRLLDTYGRGEDPVSALISLMEAIEEIDVSELRSS